MNEVIISDVHVQVTNDAGVFHVMLLIGNNIYDISEMTASDEAVADAVMSLEAMKS